MDFAMVKERLERHTMRSRLVNHPFFEQLESAEVTRELAARFVGQWWHPLHYFPTFLSRTIASASSLVVKTATSRILFQELGEGIVAQAHESIYVSTMQDAGFAYDEITQARPLPTTAALVRGYEEASREECTGIGFLYATEVADLAMVSAIGTAVRRAVGARELKWVDIHIQQEPDHVEEANNAVPCKLSEMQSATIMQTAESAWRLWTGFFDALEGLSVNQRCR